MAIFSDRVAGISAELGNRADLTAVVAPAGFSRIIGWIRDSYINLCMSYQFETLENSANAQLVKGQNSIPYPPDARMIQALTLYGSNGTVIQPDYKDLKYFRMFNQQGQGPPSVWTTQNDQILFAPTADNTYNVIIDYLQLPQIIANNTVVDPSQSTQDISSTPILLPYDWLEILDYGAKMRGHASLLEREKAQELQQLLFGYTIPLTNKFVPGLIGQIMTRREAQAPTVDYGMQPRSPKRPFTNV